MICLSTRRTSSVAALALAASTFLAFPALAQDATTEPPAEAPAEAPATAQEAASQSEAPAEPQPGQPYFLEEIGDWRVRCVKAPNEGQVDVCQLYQLLRDKSGNAVAEFTVLPARTEQDPNIQALATVVTPLETLLPPGLRMRIDDGANKTIPFTWCNPTGCYARFGLDAQDVEALKIGGGATLTITPLAAPDQQVVLSSSLTGFTLAFDKVDAGQ